MGRKLKRSRCNSKYKTSSKGSKKNHDLIEYVPKTLVKKKFKNPKLVDTVVNSIQHLTFPIRNALLNTHNNLRPQVDCFATNLSTSSRADQDVDSDEISFLYDHTTSYLTDSVIFQGIKSRIGINFYTDFLKAPSTPL